MRDAKHLVPGQRRKLELDPAEIAERAFRTDEQVGHVETARRRHVEVVARDAALDLRHARGNLVLFADVVAAHDVDQVRVAPRAVDALADRADLAEFDDIAAREPGFYGQHVVHHVAVADRACAAAVVRGHSADRRLGGGRYVDGVPEPVRLQIRVQPVEDDAGLDPDRPPGHIEIVDPGEILAVIDDDRLAHGLTALRTARAARQYRDVRIRGDLKRRERVVSATRHDDAERVDLVDRRIRGVAGAGKRVEQHLAIELAPEAGF